MDRDDANSRRNRSWSCTACGCILLPGVVVLHSVVHAFISAEVAGQRSHSFFGLKSDVEALLLYAHDNSDHFPPDMSTGKAIQPHLLKYVVESGPGEARQFQAVLEDGGIVLGNPLLSKRSTHELADESQTVAIYADMPGWPDHGIAAYCDGHVRTTPLGVISKQLSTNPFVAPNTGSHDQTEKATG